ncbi:ras-responsive element-binding protein 1 [Gouania willdenowi]|uniref:ras-responsive element-binding protein 1 n=1 Tax=Gouania willdenowi TaxID=441366 RepID=UPI001056803A|nr:ras-responsive element-binding protein 1 [Gouania willdenowi]
MMENTANDLHKEGGANSEITEEQEAELMVKMHNDLKGTEAVGGAHMLTNGSADGAGEELSSINAMMSAVMSAGNINGGDEEAGSTITSANSSAVPSPSPSPTKSIIAAMRAPPSRNARRSQETKEESSPLICPLCDKSCQSQHQLTMHIRQHNADTGNTDHSCSICGKCLSSASSLDRHMLVHSGERPYRCSVCAQTFTTNGNMHS